MSKIFKSIKGQIFLNDPRWSEEKRQERVLVRRLDIFFMSYLSLSAIVKYLDQQNIGNAYVSGMKEDLNLFGNELNFFTTYFNIGYLIVIPISSYVINSVVRPSIWLPTLELVWGILTGIIAAAKNAKTVYGIRFLIGFCEGTAWPGTMILLLSWYTPAEIGLRLAVFQSFTYLGGIFAGALQAALYTNLNGHSGLAGWQWLFVVNACITVAVAGWGYIGCPDYPNKPNPLAKWLKPEDVEIGLRRMGNQGRALPVGWSWKTAKSLVTRPQNWAIWAGYTIYCQGATGNGYFNLWLKSLKNANGHARYTVSQINTIPIACSCINIVSLLIILTISDRFQTRWPFLIFGAINGLIWSAVLAGWNVSDGVKMASFFLINFSAPGANLFVAWVGQLAKHSAEERSAIIAAFVTTYYAITAGMPLKVWPAKEAPIYKIGWKYASSMYAAVIPVILIVVFLEQRQQRIDNRKKDVEVNDSANAPEEEIKYSTPYEENLSKRDIPSDQVLSEPLPRI
ncbi:uncharacterized protein I206_101101 [Kwoniella pini CBS 10737]|uniref:Major facilitator superfamily (MFS) profile domain-containing protein n=1 Tax=Kwoniella pini CBS 10737 TaxID=1296096 RepID=A0A1B9IBU2_9TREE|nr:uncharacterized protein I206_00225 [Kwoniella pini CBS 10737]OCF52924.1 hypothetical protein I206_00225 [Kwoniella pini CBS 10737]